MSEKIICSLAGFLPACHNCKVCEHGKEKKEKSFIDLIKKRIVFARGLQLYKNEVVCGFAIPLTGEIGIISFEDILNKNLLYRDDFQVPIKRINQATLRTMSKKEANEYLKGVLNA